ncbi:MAG: FAD-linked oxidase C-terminal domain-containing protein [Thermodesulfobacteriota bacterium]
MIEELKNVIKNRLYGILDADSVLSTDEQLVAFECDALTNYRVKPQFVVLPSTTEQVSEIIKLCYEYDIPFVPRGAGTGLSGGALPDKDGILISLSKMNKILEIDIPNRLVVVEPGVVNRWVSEAVDEYGYYYAPDPSSQIVCTIGGNIAENSGGVHCLKYGVTTNHVLGIEMVLPDGEVVEIGGKTIDSPGYDLLSIVVGSEGLLGIVTKVILKITRKPQTIKTLFASYDKIEDAGASVSGIISRGVIPAGMEIMDNTCIRAVQISVKAGYPEDAGAILLVELDGPSAEVESQLPIVKTVLNENSAKEIKVAKDDAERELFWKGRKSAFAAMGQVSPDYYVQDGVIPRFKLAEVLAEIKDLSNKYGLTVANVFHAGDGNLHPLILYNSKNEGEFENVEKLAGEILQVCVDTGGSITGEHGVGYDKKDYIPMMFTEMELDTMNLLRCTFDPTGICNPGKLFPTPRTCAEHGMSHEKTIKLQEHADGELF